MPSKTPRQARFMAMCAHGGGRKGGPKCPPAAVSAKFNKADEGGYTLSKGVKEINRNRAGNRFAPGLKPGAAGPRKASRRSAR